jgi:hypothetical protein
VVSIERAEPFSDTAKVGRGERDGSDGRKGGDRSGFPVSGAFALSTTTTGMHLPEIVGHAGDPYRSRISRPMRSHSCWRLGR